MSNVMRCCTHEHTMHEKAGCVFVAGLVIPSHLSVELKLCVLRNMFFLSICVNVLVVYSLPSSYEGCCTFMNCPQTTECTLCSSTCTFVCMHLYLMRGKCGEVDRDISWNWIWDLLRGGWDNSSSFRLFGVDGLLIISMKNYTNLIKNQFIIQLIQFSVKHKHTQIVIHEISHLYAYAYKFAMVSLVGPPHRPLWQRPYQYICHNIICTSVAYFSLATEANSLQVLYENTLL